MRWLKLGWVAVLLIFFFLFSAWYGGKSKPLSQEEGAILLEQLLATHGADVVNVDGLYQNMQDMIPRDNGREFYAVNLERIKDSEAARAADRAYARIVFPLLIQRASHPVFVSERAGLMLGEYGNEVDRVAVVRYRSLRDLLTMAAEPAMAMGSDDKFAALEHTEVFITRPTITFLHVRFVLALVLLLLGLAGWSLIGWLQSRTARDA